MNERKIKRIEKLSAQLIKACEDACVFTISGYNCQIDGLELLMWDEAFEATFPGTLVQSGVYKGRHQEVKIGCVKFINILAEKTHE